MYQFIVREHPHHTLDAEFASSTAQHCGKRMHAFELDSSCAIVRSGGKVTELDNSQFGIDPSKGHFNTGYAVTIYVKCNTSLYSQHVKNPIVFSDPSSLNTYASSTGTHTQTVSRIT